MIIRVKKRDTFTCISNETLRDENLSYETLGLLVSLLSRPDNWTVNVRTLSGSRGAGNHKTRKMLKELSEAGYLVRTQRRGKDGGWEWEVSIYERPFRPCVDYPHADEPHADEPHADNRHVLRSNDRRNNDLRSNEKEKDQKTLSDQKKKEEKTALARKWIDVLNEKTGRRFRNTAASIGPALARISEGFSVEDAEAVVVDRFRVWGKDHERSEYLRPQTLFGTKFEGYLQAARDGTAEESVKEVLSFLHKRGKEVSPRLAKAEAQDRFGRFAADAAFLKWGNGGDRVGA